MKNPLVSILEKTEKNVKKEEMSSVLVFSDDNELTYALVVPDQSCVKLTGKSVVDFEFENKSLEDVHNEYLRFLSLNKACQTMMNTTQKIADNLHEVLEGHLEGEKPNFEDLENEQAPSMMMAAAGKRYDN